MSPLPCKPFEEGLRLGTVTEVSPDAIRFEVDRPIGQIDELSANVEVGEVGQFVCAQAPGEMPFGRIVDAGKTDEGVIATAHLLTSVSLEHERDMQGIGMLPAIGAKVYVAEPSLISWLACGASDKQRDRASLDLGHLGAASEPVRLDANRLFGRGCAVLGTSGSGKSWTVARLLEQSSKYRAKTILLDATGEYATLGQRTMHVQVGAHRGTQAIDVGFPHRELVEDDLFALFTPGGEVQGPRMRAAIRSLKLAAILGADRRDLVFDGCVPKAGRGKEAFNAAYTEHAARIHQPSADFNIELLPRQIELECVWPSAYSNIQGQRDHSVWGDENSADIAMCDALVSRIQGFLQAEEFACLFDANGSASLPAVIDEFMASDDHAVLRISMQYLSFSMHVREVVANAIGRLLLRRARGGQFSRQPVVLFLDEAHQFLNKALGEEHARYPLDAFDLIAKEGRKYSLSLCLSTQRPGDIPEGVLSQLGTMIVHRLVNRRDRDAVEQGVTHLDQSAARFLPTFSPGEVVIVGVHSSIPLSVQISPPDAKPDSLGADFDSGWSGSDSGERSADTVDKPELPSLQLVRHHASGA